MAYDTRSFILFICVSIIISSCALPTRSPGIVQFSDDRRYLYEIPLTSQANLLIFDSSTNKSYTEKDTSLNLGDTMIVPICKDIVWLIEKETGKCLSMIGPSKEKLYNNIYDAISDQYKRIIECDNISNWLIQKHDRLIYVLGDFSKNRPNYNSFISIYDGIRWVSESSLIEDGRLFFLNANKTIVMISIQNPMENSKAMGRIIPDGKQFESTKAGYYPNSANVIEGEILFDFWPIEGPGKPGGKYYDHVFKIVDLNNFNEKEIEIYGGPGQVASIFDSEILLIGDDAVYIYNHKVAASPQEIVRSKASRWFSIVRNDRVIDLWNDESEIYEIKNGKISNNGRFSSFIEFYKMH